jgi:hypothetical protein
MPESIVFGYHCLTNSGGATAPHNWIILAELTGSTWYYENLCIMYGAQGKGVAKFREPSGTITTKALRYGVLARASGMPEEESGTWFLYHEGIGDPQVEQLTYHTGSKEVGKAWPFTKGTCPF